MSRERANGELEGKVPDCRHPLREPCIPPMGWVCPKCGNVYAPHVALCLYCQPGMPFTRFPVPTVGVPEVQ